MNTSKKRIDELGRLVIPKEIRKSLKLDNFDEVELRVEKEKIIITKSIAINLYKEKITCFLDFLNSICDFNVIVFDKDNNIINTYKGLEGKISVNLNDNNIEKTEIKIGKDIIMGYVYLEKIIIDSNLLGYILFISDELFKNKDELKKVKKIIIDLID